MGERCGICRSENTPALGHQERGPKRSDKEDEDGGDGPGLDVGQEVTPIRSRTQHQKPRNIHVCCLRAPQSVSSQIRLISRWTSQITSRRRQSCCSSSAPCTGRVHSGKRTTAVDGSMGLSGDTGAANPPSPANPANLHGPLKRKHDQPRFSWKRVEISLSHRLNLICCFNTYQC